MKTILLFLTLIVSCAACGQNASLSFGPTPLYTGNNLMPWNNPTLTVDADGIVSKHFNASLSQAYYIPSNSRLQAGATDLTICGWIKLDALGAPRVMACKDNDSTSEGSEYYQGYYPSYGSFVFQVETLVNTTKYVISSSGQPIVGVWNFVVGSYDHVNGKVYIEVNNSFKDSVTGVASTTHITNTGFTIGSDANSGQGNFTTPHGGFMNGSLKSVQLFKRLLTAAEKTVIYNQTALRTNYAIATLHNTSWATDVPSALSANVNWASFNGTSSYLRQTFYDTLQTNRSFSAWFKATAFGGAIFSYDTTFAAKGGGSTLYITNSTTITLQTNLPSDFPANSPVSAAFTVPTMSTGTPYNVIITVDLSGNAHCYLNGTESSSGGISLTGQIITINEFGKYWDGSSGGWWSGKIGEIQFFRSLLTSTDIAAIASGGYATQTSPQNNFKLKEGTGTTVHDYSAGWPLTYLQLPLAFQNEPSNTFVGHWDLSELSGVGYDRAPVEFSRNLNGAYTLDFPSTSAGTSSDITVTLNGAVAGEIVAIGVPSEFVLANSSFSAQVTAANTVKIRFNNQSSSPLDPASGLFKLAILRP